MKIRFFRLLSLLVVLALLVPACKKGDGKKDPIYLSIIWHQHQPVYLKDSVTGIYAKPWVRVHAAKDYVDMAAMLKQYPQIHVTFNLTPSLIRQLDDFKAGAKDLYWVIADIPAEQLTAEQKQFLLDRFFDTNRKVIARFPRYQELLTKRDAQQEFTVQDYRDLQVLFNLAWTDPDWLAKEPLAALVSKGKDYAEADKKIVFDEHLKLINQVIPVHKELQDKGQIEVTMTPFAHPILPLLISTALAKSALPDIELPGVEFAYGADAVAQVKLGVDLYKDHFGRSPSGMWPAEGSVAQEIISIVANNGIQWMASDEGVLANSLGFPSFTRDAKETVTQPEKLYRPYYVQGGVGNPVAIIFRDVVISDKVGFTYSGISGTAAAKDFISRVHAIRDSLQASGKKGPFLVSVILDGENAWENYPNDGKEFLNALYQGLTDDPYIKTVTPSEFLKMSPEQPKIEKLWAGSWISHDFSTWIGESEENRAWEYLTATRELLQKYETGIRSTSPENLEKAKTLMYIAEGSDWFWWFGADQNSGDDGSFDAQFRETLKQVYATLGETPPGSLDVPIIPQQAIGSDQPSTGLISPTVDGRLEPGEWDAAGVYQASGGVMASALPYFSSLAYGFDAKNLYFAITADPKYSSLSGEDLLEIYFSAAGGGPTDNFSRGSTLLGFPANRMVEVQFKSGGVASAKIYPAAGDEKWGDPTSLDAVAAQQGVLELGIPLTLLGNPETGDRLSFRLIHREPLSGVAGDPVDTDQLPGSGPALVSVPDLGTTILVLDIADPEKDDFGPGTYAYPKDAVFQQGCFDILNFQVGYDEQNIVFKFSLRGPVENPWGSPNGLSIQTFDIYIDKDGDGQGGVAMLPGRNLALQDGYAWDIAITAEGWEPGIFTLGPDGKPQKIAEAAKFTVLADSSQQKVTIRVPKSILGDNPDAWMYAAVVLSQEGYPSGGVMRVRDVQLAAEQWRIGGGQSGANNQTRVMDFVWPTAGEQEKFLSAFTPSGVAQTELTVADFAKVPMLAVEK